MQKLTAANEDTVRRGLEHLRIAYDNFVNSVVNTGGDISYVDGLMIAHNFHKLVMEDVIQRQDGGPAAALALRKVMVDTWQEAVWDRVVAEQ